MNSLQRALVTGDCPIFSIPTDIASSPAASRSRKSHTKSRLGCRNCKQRRVKCDETLPECTQCGRRGLVCKYAPKTWKAFAPVQLAPAPTLDPLVETKLPRLVNMALIQSYLLESSGPSETFSLQDLAGLQQFESVTCNSIASNSISRVYRAELPKLAVQHLHLLHGILAITSLHLQYLKTSTTVPDQKSLFHWQRCLHYFGKKVPSAIAEDDADAMLGTSTLVSGIAFAMMEETIPSQPWPLGRSRQLSWIKIQCGIDLIFQAVRPLGQESAIRRLFLEMDDDEGDDEDRNSNAVGVGLSESLDNGQQQIIPPYIGGPFHELWTFCESDGPASPYHEALAALAPLQHVPCDSETLLYHLSFITALSSDFQKLLENKDHKALLIMSFWYAGLCNYDCWWTQQRSLVECRAICEYLGTHANDGRILKLLRFPARECGYRG